MLLIYKKRPSCITFFSQMSYILNEKNMRKASFVGVLSVFENKPRPTSRRPELKFLRRLFLGNLIIRR